MLRRCEAVVMDGSWRSGSILKVFPLFELCARGRSSLSLKDLKKKNFKKKFVDASLTRV